MVTKSMRRSSGSVASFAAGARRQVRFPEALARDLAVEAPLAFVHHEEALAAVESWLESVTLNGNEIAGK